MIALAASTIFHDRIIGIAILAIGGYVAIVGLLAIWRVK